VPLTYSVVPFPYSSRVSGFVFNGSGPMAGKTGINRCALTRIAQT